MTERKPVYFWMRNLLQKLDATTKCGVLSCHSCTTSLIMHFTNWNARKKVVVSGSFRCWRIRHAMQATYALLFCELEFIYIAKVDRYKKICGCYCNLYFLVADDRQVACSTCHPTACCISLRHCHKILFCVLRINKITLWLEI